MAAEALATPTVPRDSTCSPSEQVASSSGTCLLSRRPRLSSPSDRLPGSQAGRWPRGTRARAGVLTPVPSAELPPSLHAALERPSAQVPHVLVGSSERPGLTLGAPPPPHAHRSHSPHNLCPSERTAASCQPPSITGMEPGSAAGGGRGAGHPSGPWAAPEPLRAQSGHWAHSLVRYLACGPVHGASRSGHTRRLFRPLHGGALVTGQGLQPVHWPPCSPQPVGGPGTSVRVPGCTAAPKGSQRRGRCATLSQYQQHEAVHSGPLRGTAE